VTAPGGAVAEAGAASAPFELRAGALRLAVRPDLGGAVAGLWHGVTPILRSSEPGRLRSAREAALFALLPYASRLGQRRFRWRGHEHTTRANVADSPHSLHGVGWQRPWRIVASSALEVVLELCHGGDADWPFAFSARQYLSLGAGSFDARLQIVNDDAREQPVGLGWLAAFVARPRSRIHVEVEQRWDGDATLLPTRAVAQHGIDSDVAHLAFDNCFDGWRGAARLRDERFSLRLSSSLTRLVVCTPPEGDHFSVAPVSHVTNAIHMADPLAHGLVALAPGAALDAWMRLDCALA
jgi:aldose 1-epimerase